MITVTIASITFIVYNRLSDELSKRAREILLYRVRDLDETVRSVLVKSAESSAVLMASLPASGLPSDTSGVVTNVPQSATRKDPVTVSQTCR